MPAAGLGIAQRLDGEERRHRDRPDRQADVEQEMLDLAGGPGKEVVAEALLEQVGGAGQRPQADAHGVVERDDPGTARQPGRPRRDERGQMELEADLEPGQQVGAGQRRRADPGVADGAGRQRHLAGHRRGEEQQQEAPHVQLALAQREEGEAQEAERDERGDREVAPAGPGAGNDRERERTAVAQHPHHDRPAGREARRREVVIGQVARRGAADVDELVTRQHAGPLGRQPGLHGGDEDAALTLVRHQADAAAGALHHLLCRHPGQGREAGDQQGRQQHSGGAVGAQGHTLSIGSHHILSQAWQRVRRRYAF